MKQYIILLVSCVFVLSSCKDEAQSLMQTESGYTYQVISKGKGKAISKGDFAYFNAEVVSLDGNVVFRSADSGQPGLIKLENPQTGQKPNPFVEALQGANVGDSIHIHLGKDESAGSGFDSLIYKMRIFDGMDEESYRAKMDEERKEAEKMMAVFKEAESSIAEKVDGIYKSIKDGSAQDIQTTESGLKYIMHEKGAGELYKPGQMAKVNYYGVLSRNGEEFDNSWKRGKPFEFPLGQRRVILGWDEGVALLPKGSKATLIVPGNLGYGERGSGKIQPNDELIFYIEVQE